MQQKKLSGGRGDRMKGNFYCSRDMCEAIVSGLGGRANILTVDCCATRLRCRLIKAEAVDEGVLKSTGALGIIRRNCDIQVVYGAKVPVIKNAVLACLEALDAGSAFAGHEIKTETLKVKKRRTLDSPFQGAAAPISACADEAFADKLMGDGYIVTPTEGIVVAPENGTISFTAPEGYAVGFLAEDGLECMLHVGVDTVLLKGCGFRLLVAEGQRVKKGERLIEFDLDYIRSHAASEQCIAVFTALTEGEDVVLYAEGALEPLEKVAEIVSG